MSVNLNLMIDVLCMSKLGNIFSFHTINLNLVL